MKKALLTLIFAAAMAAPCSADILTVVSPSSVTLGNTFDVTVELTDIFAGRPSDTLIAFGFNFNYDTTAFTLESEIVDPNWLDISDLSLTPPQIGGLTFTGFTAGTPEPLVLATLTLRADAIGPSTFSVSSDSNDPNTGIVFDTGYDQFAVSQDITVTPEPAALFLFGTVLLLSAVRLKAARRRASISAR